MKRKSSGFTLIEVMIVVAIVGILGAIALPAYGSYLMRGRLVEAFSGLTSAQTSAEEYWSNAHTYAGFDTDTPSRMPVATTNFTFAYSNASASGYLITATGRNQAAGFTFTIDQSGKRVTTTVPAGWTANSNCWIDRKGGLCAQ